MDKKEGTPKGNATAKGGETGIKGYNKVTSLDQMVGQRGLRMAHLNIRSLKANIASLRIEMEKEPVDLLGISETWLKEGDEKVEYALGGYDVICQNRERLNAQGKVKKGGGSCIVQQESCKFQGKED